MQNVVMNKGGATVHVNIGHYAGLVGVKYMHRSKNDGSQRLGRNNNRPVSSNPPPPRPTDRLYTGGTTTGAASVTNDSNRMPPQRGDDLELVR